MKVNCTGREGLVGDVAKSFGDLNCIFCLLRGDKVDSMANIGWGKLCWMTIRGLLELRMLFKVKSEDGRGMNTSDRGNRVSRMASIRHGEDSAL
jgi:hypothetical protein